MAMTNALTMAMVSYEDVDYINAHGTGTPLNDIMETLAIKSVSPGRALFRFGCSALTSDITDLPIYHWLSILA